MMLAVSRRCCRDAAPTDENRATAKGRAFAVKVQVVLRTWSRKRTVHRNKSCRCADFPLVGATKYIAATEAVLRRPFIAVFPGFPFVPAQPGDVVGSMRSDSAASTPIVNGVASQSGSLRRSGVQIGGTNAELQFAESRPKRWLYQLNIKIPRTRPTATIRLAHIRDNRLHGRVVAVQNSPQLFSGFGNLWQPR